MTRRRLILAVRSWTGVLAALIVVASATWLVAEYVHARLVTPRETALVDALKLKARTDTEVQKVLLPEFDRQREALARRHRAYSWGGPLLLISLGVFLAWVKWLRPGRGEWVGVPRWLPGLVWASPDGGPIALPPASAPAGRARRTPAVVVSRTPRGEPQPRPRPARSDGPPVEIRIGTGTCGLAAGALDVKTALENAVASLGGNAVVKPVGCSGACRDEPLVEVVSDGDRVSYGRVAPEDARALVRAHVTPRGPIRRLRAGLADARARLVDDRAWVPISDRSVDTRSWSAGQVRIALENCGSVDPGSLDDYRRHDGYRGLEHCLARLTPEEVIEVVGAAGLRERGGTGVLLASAWGAVRQASGAAKQILCVSDDVEPRVFIDRTILEGDPFRVIEGLSIAAYTVGASGAVIHLGRANPAAADRLRDTVAAAEAHGLLGRGILGSSFDLDVQIRAGAGPAADNDAAIVHHVETLAALPWILRRGSEAFAALGTARSKGTKVFSLAGSIKRAGFIEVPLGTSVRTIVEEIGGGIEDGRSFKAVLVGGRAGVCIPAAEADTPIDFETMAASGAALASGGLVVLDERDCAVEIARRYLRAVAHQPSSKGAGSRDGIRRMTEIVERIRDGRGTEGDLATLESLSRDGGAAGAAGSPAALPDTVWTTLRHFRHEYEAHVRERRCPAAACKGLIHYRVLSSCIGCTLCAQACRTGAIEARPYLPHEVDDDRCKRCGMCRASCPEHAIEVS